MKLTIDQIYAIANGGAIKRLMQINMSVSLAFEVAESVDKLDELVRQAEAVRVGIVQRMQVNGQIPQEKATEFNHLIALLFSEVKEIDFPKLDRKMLDNLGEVTPAEAKGFAILLHQEKPAQPKKTKRGHRADTKEAPIETEPTERPV